MSASGLGGTFGYTNASYTQTVYATQAAAQVAAADPSSGFFSIVQNGDHLPGAPWTASA